LIGKNKERGEKKELHIDSEIPTVIETRVGRWSIKGNKIVNEQEIGPSIVVTWL
jgi:hypothetical protein